MMCKSKKHTNYHSRVYGYGWSISIEFLYINEDREDFVEEATIILVQFARTFLTALTHTHGLSYLSTYLKYDISIYGFSIEE